MNFIDHTGHIFTSKSYAENPLGYEFEETPYIFWFNTEYGYKLSVNTYYFQPIRLVFKVPNNYTFGTGIYINDFIHITAQEESVIKIMGSTQLQNVLKNAESFVGNFNFYEYDGIVYDKERVWDTEENKWIYGNKLFVQNLTNSDFYILNDIQNTDYFYFEQEYYTYADGAAGEYNGTIKQIDNKLYGEIQLGDDITDVELTKHYKSIIIEDIENIDNNIYNGHQVKESVSHYIVVPFYAVIKSANDGVWESNLLIHTSIAGVEEYCPITLGAEIVDECEELIINGHNMGVNLPKQILSAVYSNSYYGDYPDEKSYANKLKEYLINYSLIKGQTGNMRSAIAGLKWFGWGDKINLYQLLKTDNEFQLTYVRDAFDIVNDTIFTFNNFRLSTLISLGVKINEESEETQFDIYERDSSGEIIIVDNKPVHKNQFWGELKPEMVSLIDKVITQTYDETGIEFYRGYFDFCFQELGLKLCALKYYYKKYFLPIHLGENTVSLEHQCFMNDIKLMIRPHNSVSEEPILTNGYKQNRDYHIEFPGYKTLFFNHEVHYVDANYCEFGGTKDAGENNENNCYYINDTLISVPIQFVQEKEEQYYNCVLLLVKDDTLIHEAHFSFVQNKTVEHRDTWFKNFVIHPKTINTVLTGEVTEKFDINFWLNSSYTIHLCVNNIWYSYDFTMAVPELNISLGKLKYQYYLNTSETFEKENGKKTLFNQISGFGVTGAGNDCIKFNNFMFQPDLVTSTNSDFIEDILNYAEDKNIVYLDGKNIAIGSFYYYLEYNDVKYIFSDKQNVLLKEINGIITIVDNDNIEIKYCGDGTYSLLFRKTKEKIVNLNLQTNIFQNLEQYITNYYTASNHFIDDKYLNEIHLIDIFDENWKPLVFDINSQSSVLGTMILGISKLGIDTAEYGAKLKFYYAANILPQTVAMYKQFFNTNGESIFDIPVNYKLGEKSTKYEGQVLNDKLNKTQDVSYDFYLMHDNAQWHIILVSKNTVDNMVEKDLEFTFPEDINLLTIGADGYKWSYTTLDDKLNDGKAFLKIVDESNSLAPHVYYLAYNRSDKNILINRLEYERANGINHFDKGDIIACTLTNNDKLPFKLDYGSKWVFTPTSIGMNEESKVQSPSEMAIISIGNANSKYETGYYDVTCNYTLDDFAQHTYTKRAKLRINKDTN